MSFGLFQVAGIEVEYMLVDGKTLMVRPESEELLRSVAGDYACETEWDGVGWSNELVRHLIEFKTPEPISDLSSWEPLLHRSVVRANQVLEPSGATLLPTGMHPFMNPATETRLWEKGHQEVYRAFDRIFGCSTHGFANLQSVHINLPFADDDEFFRLHTAVRAVLPLIPGLTASSPLQEGRVTGFSDTRLHAYRLNQRKIPAIAGAIIPEAVATRAEYVDRILIPAWNAIEPYDGEGVLRHEWLNSRGAIARFERNALEIRLVDTQECPHADLAAAALIIALVKALVEERFCSFSDQLALSESTLVAILSEAISSGGRAIVADEAFLRLFDLGPGPRSALDLWRTLHQRLESEDRSLPPFADAYRIIFSEGTLADRILATARMDKDGMVGVYRLLAQSLAQNRLYSDPALSAGASPQD